MDIKSEYVLTVAPLVSMEVFRRFCTGHLSVPDNALTDVAAGAASALLFMVLILKTYFYNDKRTPQFANFETIVRYPFQILQQPLRFL